MSVVDGVSQESVPKACSQIGGARVSSRHSFAVTTNGFDLADDGDGLIRGLEVKEKTIRKIKRRRGGWGGGGGGEWLLQLEVVWVVGDEKGRGLTCQGGFTGGAGGLGSREPGTQSRWLFAIICALFSDIFPCSTLLVKQIVNVEQDGVGSAHTGICANRTFELPVKCRSFQR